MRYRGYRAAIAFDTEAGLFHGDVLDIVDTVTFQGRTIADVTRALADSVDDYLAFCAARGEVPAAGLRSTR